MPSYKDVALVNSSLDALSDSLLKQRMIDQQEKDKQAALDIQRQGLDVRQNVGMAQAGVRSQNAAERARHNQALEGNKQNAQEEARKKNAQQMWGDTVKMYGTWVDKRIMEPGQAQGILQQSYAKMPDQAKSYIADHPSVQAILSDQPLFKAPAGDKSKDIQPKTTTITLPDGRKVDTIYNPQTGSFHMAQAEKGPVGPKVSVEIDANGKPTKRTVSGAATDVAAELQGGYLMTDPQGNTVRVPAARKAEMLKKGYAIQQQSQ